MNVVVTVSGYIIPAVMLFIVIHGMIKKVNVYDEFVTGAKDGMMWLTAFRARRF